nr:hypothetical protein [uncultured Psychroserpens sp.]
MKKTAFLLVLIIFTFSFQSCENCDDDNSTIEPQSEFSGEWNGTYSGDLNGTWVATISNSGIVSGTVTTSSGESGSLSGSVTVEGLFTVTAGSTAGGSDFIGNLDNNIASGTWQDRTSDLNGTWEGQRD